MLRLRQRLFQFAADVRDLGLRLPVFPPKFEQIGARNDSGQLPGGVQYRNLSPPAFDHQPVQRADGRVSADGKNAFAHHFVDGQRA